MITFLDAPARLERAGAVARAPRRRHARWGILAGAALAALAATPGQALAQFGAYPVIVDFDAPDTATQAVTVLNEASEPIVLRAYLGDFEQLTAGNHEYGPLGAHPMSCAGRLQVYPESVTLEPGQKSQLRVEMAPGDTPCWSALFVERVMPDASAATFRIAVKVHGNPPGAVADAQMVSVDVEPVPAGMEAVVTLDNTGVRNLRPEGTLEIRDLDGQVIHSERILPFGALPGHRRTIRVPLPDDLPGSSLLAIPLLEIGAEFLLGGQAAFQGQDAPQG